MQFKKTLIFLLVFLVLCGVYFIVQNIEKDAEPVDLTKELFSLDVDQIQAITLAGYESKVYIEKVEGVWQAPEAPGIELDQNRLQGLVVSLANLTAEKIIKETLSKDDMNEFGFREQSTHVIVKLANGELHEGWVGYKTPMEDGYYFRRAERDVVYKVDPYIGEKLKPILENLRNRQAFSIVPDEVEEFTLLRHDNVEFTIVRDGEGWKFKGGLLEKKPDTAKVNGFLNIILGTYVSHFSKDNPESYNPYGLENPLVRIIVKAKDKTEEVYYGMVTTEEYMYARRMDKPWVLLVKMHILDVYITPEQLLPDQQNN